MASSRRGNGEGRHGMKCEHREKLSSVQWRQITPAEGRWWCVAHPAAPNTFPHTSHTPKTGAKQTKRRLYD